MFTNPAGSATTTAASLTVVQAPAITGDPSPQSVIVGQTATFTASASGTPTPTVQWEVNSGGGFTAIPGAHRPPTASPPASVRVATCSRPCFTNSAGSATTTAASLTVSQAAVTGTSVSWGSVGTAALGLPAAPGGLLLPAGRKTDLPWLGIDQIGITLNAPEVLAASDVTLTSAIGAQYGPVTVGGSGTSYTITLAAPINLADRVGLTIGNADVASFSGQLAVLPGDVNDDGVVNVQDLVAVQQQWLGIVSPTIFGDITGDGTPTAADYLAVRKRIGTTLPPPSTS